MQTYSKHDAATSNVLAWTAHAANAVEEEAGADADEPPDRALQCAAMPQHSFQKKAIILRPREHAESLITRALQSQSEDDDSVNSSGLYPRRRRSITSNISLASTAGCTSDTGITTPPRTNSPSPRLVSFGLAPINIRFRDDSILHEPSKDVNAKASAAPQKPRRISFACGGVKPCEKDQPASTPPTNGLGPEETPKAGYAQLVHAAQVTPVPQVEAPIQAKRPSIRFACPARPSADAHKPEPATKMAVQEPRKLHARKPSPAPEAKSPVSTRKLLRGGSSGPSPRSLTRPSASRQSSHSPLVRAKKYYNAAPGDLNGESSRFHEFASDGRLEEDWIRQGQVSGARRLTIDDTLKKELAIRRLGKEAEEEAEQEDEDEEEVEEEEEDDEDDLADEDDEDEDDEDEDDQDEEDGDENETLEDDDDYHVAHQPFSGYSSGEDASDGYNTDNETGFASSDEEDDGLVLWTVNRSAHQRREHNFDNDHTTLHQPGSLVFRRLSVDEHSDSSAFVAGQAVRQDRPKNRELSKITRPSPPELPDSTDFVCGTFDEDRPLEEAYLSHIEARKRGKLHVIPQDFDPSFPTSDPEENSDGELVNYKQRAQQAHGSAEEQIWEMEDIHDQEERPDARRRKKAESPRRYRSPPPPVKNRGRSPAPRRLFDRQSPTQKAKHPAPKAVPVPVAAHIDLLSPRASPVEVAAGKGKPAFPVLAFKPGLTHAKSLPRPPAIFRHPAQQQPHNTNANHGNTKSHHRRPKANSLVGAKQPGHVRGAIDIVKGLEQKRQRRKEKFQQKYCNRARKGHVHERRTQRGEGAERMREIGLLMAGKIPQANYVLSV